MQQQYVILCCVAGMMTIFSAQGENTVTAATKWFYHPPSRMNLTSAFDMGVQRWIVSQPNYQLGGIAGYQQTRYSWAALSGFYQNDNGAKEGAFERGSNLGGYRQQFDVSYLGVIGILRYQNVELSALAKYSPWAKARDNDELSFRQLTFRNEGNNGRYYSVLVDIGYYLTSCAKVFTALSWHKYDDSRGGAQFIDQVSGEQGYIGGHAAGIAHEYYRVTAGLTYRF